MATLVSDPVRYVADQWENNCGYASAVLSGIVPDSRHLDNGGYHPSVEDLRRFGNADDYSNTRPDDRNFNIKYGAAIDMSMSPADMRKCHDRMRKVWADKTDPRRKYLNAFNTWDGSGDAVRLDFVANTAKYASPDHKWHCHCEKRRRYLLDMTAARANVSALRGDSKATYLASIGQGKDDDMTPEEHSWLATVHEHLTVLDGRNPVGQIYTRMALGEDHVAGAKYQAAHPSLKDISGQVGALTAHIAGLRAVVESLASTIQAGGGSVETTAILAGVDRAVAAAVATMTAETRDAVADLGEGGAEQVRADG